MDRHHHALVNAFADVPALTPEEVEQLREDLSAANPSLAQQLGLAQSAPGPTVESQASIETLLDGDIERVSSFSETFSILVGVDGNPEEPMEVVSTSDVERTLRTTLNIPEIDEMGILFGGYPIPSGTFEESGIIEGSRLRVVITVPSVLPMRTPVTAKVGIDVSGASGLIFDMEALNDIKVISIETGHWYSPGAGYELYVAKNEGSYKDQMDPADWELIAAASYNGPNRQPFRIQFEHAVPIPAGARKAFYLYGCVCGDHRVVAGIQGNTAEDENLRVHPGDCADPNRWRRFNVSYYELAGSVEYMPVVDA